MTHKVCILAAGLGTRVRDVFSLSNKALMPVDGKAAISHIIDAVDPSVEIVVAVGYKADDVIEYVSHAYPLRPIEFVSVSAFEGPGTGPGLSLYECRDKLQCPFVVWAVDTLMLSGRSGIPLEWCTERDWVGIGEAYDASRFCCVDSVEEQTSSGYDEFIVAYHEKTKSGFGYAFVGIAGVNDHASFWRALGPAVRSSTSPQLSHGLSALRARAVMFDGWCDVGTVEADGHSLLPRPAFDFSKPDEATYDVGGRIVKLSADVDRVAAKVRRHGSLSHVLPPGLVAGQRVMSYPKVAGTTLYERLDPGIAHRFFEWASTALWHHVLDYDDDEFRAACRSMYHDKTSARLGVMTERTPGLMHGTCTVNGLSVASYEELFERVKWEELSHGTATAVHGDLQFDNVIVTDSGEFVLIDWRESFGGLDHGDVYYDLAKLLGGMTIPYDAVKQNRFEFRRTDTGCVFDVDTSLVLTECRREFVRFLPRHGFRQDRVEVLRALIFAGMSPMHHAPFDELLFYAGRYFLQQALGLA